MRNITTLARDYLAANAAESGADEIIRGLIDEIERIEKERFKFETALMLIGQGYPGGTELAKAAIFPAERAAVCAEALHSKMEE